MAQIQEDHKLTIQKLQEFTAKYKASADKKRQAVEIIKKISPNAYRLKLPSHIKISNVFNVKHLVSFIGDLSDEEANSRTNSLQPGEDDMDQITSEFMKTNANDLSVKTPRRMVMHSQTRKIGEDCPDGPSARLDL